MKFYYTGKEPDLKGVIWIHAETCKSLPDVLGRIYLGMFPNGYLAIETAKAKLQLAKVNVCKCCS